MFIDDTSPMGSLRRNKGEERVTEAGSGSASRVVYSGEDAGVQPAPLIDDAAMNQKRNQQRRQQMGAVPPPPSMVTTSGGKSNDNSSSDASLF